MALDVFYCRHDDYVAWHYYVDKRENYWNKSLGCSTYRLIPKLWFDNWYMVDFNGATYYCIDINDVKRMAKNRHVVEYAVDRTVY